jgi:hypothetical protein
VNTDLKHSESVDAIVTQVDRPITEILGKNSKQDSRLLIWRLRSLGYEILALKEDA